MYKINSFNDSHIHLLGLGYNETLIDLSNYKSIDEIKKIRSDRNIIIGRGWHQNSLIENRSLTKQDLNAISLDVPIVFIRVCGHVLVCNDKAMELVNITNNTKQFPGGTHNYNTGIFTEDSIKEIYKLFKTPTKDDIKEMFLVGQEKLLKNGITACSSDDFITLNVGYELIIECLEELYNEGLMVIKLTQQVNLPTKELLNDYINKGYHKKKYKGFKLGPLKLLADGSLGGRTALLHKEYTDDKGNYGIQVFETKLLNEMIEIAHKNGMDISIHGIGDKIITQVLDAVELANKKFPREHRHAIIHAQLATRKQILRMKQLRVHAIVQPIFLNSDIPIIEKRLGSSRAKDSYLFKSMYDNDIVVGFSTDAPVEDLNPFKNIYTALTYKSIKHNSSCFNENETFMLEEALECYTTNNYYLTHDHLDEGDYIIIDKDIYSIDIEEFKDITVLEVYIKNKQVYRRNT